MTVYCVCYDLVKDRDYTKVIEQVKSYNYYAHAQGSVWFIKSSKSASDLRDELKPFLDSDDNLLIIRVILPWASSNLPQKINDWLKEVEF